MAVLHAFAAYRTAEVEGISQRDLIVKLYEAAERFLLEACAAMRARKPSDAHFACVKAKAIFVELLSTLNLDQGGEIAARLRELYAFFIVQIAEANLRKDAERIAALLPIVATLRTAWQAVPAEHANTSALPSSDHRYAVDLRT